MLAYAFAEGITHLSSTSSLFLDALMLAAIGLVGVFCVLLLFFISIKLLQKIKK